MTGIQAGMICIKTAGKDAGQRVVVIELEKDHAIVEGAKTKRKKCNLHHLFPTPQKVSVSKTAKHDEIVAILSEKK
ncbi:MAG: 50S ribosomal protein L14e [Candidatus Micrarchaeota archaeon]